MALSYSVHMRPLQLISNQMSKPIYLIPFLSDEKKNRLWVILATLWKHTKHFKHIVIPVLKQLRDTFKLPEPSLTSTALYVHINTLPSEQIPKYSFSHGDSDFRDHLDYKAERKHWTWATLTNTCHRSELGWKVALSTNSALTVGI